MREKVDREQESTAITAIWDKSRTSCAPPSTHLHIPLSQDLAGHQSREKARAPEPQGISIWYLHQPEKERKNMFEREGREKVVFISKISTYLKKYLK